MGDESGRRTQLRATKVVGRKAAWRLRSLAFALAVLALVMAPGASGTHSMRRSAPHLASPARTAKQLVNRFFVLLAHKDRARLERFLSAGFQVQRADGSGSGKKEYLANLATINRFALARIRATQAGATLVVRYLADVEGVVNGKPYKPGPAPRLSVFTRSGRRWQLVAHANFNPLTG
jgi:Domain of unknown function (DUF4440)